MKKLNKKVWFKNALPHLTVVVGFVVLSLAIFYPLLQGKKLIQSDIRQYSGMSRQLQEHREETGTETYWIDNAFGGMPTYQLGAKYPFDILTPIHQIIRLIPQPAFFLFLYLLGSYLFLLTLGIQKKYAVLGAVAYGLSTYLLIIIQVGHNTKAQALGYLPLAFAAVFQIMQRPTLSRLVLAALALGLQIRANHYQMTYYMLLLMALYFVFEFWQHFKKQQLKDFFRKGGFVFISGLLALGLNASSMLATYEYTTFSTRGKNELTQTVNGEPIDQRSGLPYDYITQFSYGIFESFNLIAPRIQGGASGENLGESSDLYKMLIKNGASRAQAKQFIKNVPTYWGDQPILEAPAYVGIVVVFLAVLSLFLSFHSHKRWLLFGILFSLALSWGKNFDFLTRFFVDFFPLYNKFRAVSSIQIILEFCFPLLAMIGLQEYLTSPREKAFKALKNTTLTFGGLLTILFFSASMMSFRGISDAYYSNAFGMELFSAILKERKNIYSEDIIRAFCYVGILSVLLFAFTKKKLKLNYTFLSIAFLLCFDLIQISNRYLDRDLFVRPSKVEPPFLASQADQAIRQDTTHYRVYEPSLGLQGARTAYFHNSIGGYHGAKPRRFEQLMDLFQSKQVEQILNILNVKYVLYESEEGLQPLRNPDNLGNAWFVNSLVPIEDTDILYQKMANTDFQTIALVETNSLSLKTEFELDSLAKISLEINHPEKKVYSYSSTKDGFVVFSEMYYTHGWTAKIDGIPSQIFPTNYVLRGLYVPSGTHEIEFNFVPQVISRGSWIQGISIAILFVFLFVGIKPFRVSLGKE